MPPGADPTSLSARAAVAMLRSGEVSAVELVEAALRRIEATDGPLNALPTVCAERALEHAARASRDTPLGGLPLAVKDLTDVAGVRTTYGSPIYARNVPERSDILVERLEAGGGIVVAKSNTPEFGAGANTFNEVFGETRNPWDLSRTCGGSSGGSAVALATHQVWLATGSDLGGSLRTPASFCGVVGIRPSPGLVARGPGDRPFDTLSVEGPMARNVADAALMLDVMAGAHPEDPIAYDPVGGPFVSAAEEPRRPTRIAYSEDLGITPVAPEVRAACRKAVDRLAAAGFDVVEACPDLATAPDTFQRLRAAGFVADLAAEYETDRDRLKPDIVWNIEQGLRLSPAELAEADRARGALFHRMAAFFDQYDVLMCPAACVAPFDVRTRWVDEVDGVRFDNYVEWLRITSAITLTASPVVALPGGFTAAGLPVGLQLVGRNRGEHDLLRHSAAVEEALA
ncbi:MAG: amidase [Gaiellales bacterium]|nr:amidase [Gaiellales bacterium]